METMTEAPTATVDPFPAAARPMTVQDLEGMPNDARRYELIDGVLIVSPAPSTRHQKIVYRLYGVLEGACPDEFDVIGAPFAVHDETDELEVQPDILVGRYADFTPKDLPKPPVLVVEVLSPSTALIDRNLKRATFERMGVESYWIIDPAGSDNDGPVLTVFELQAGAYRQIAEVADDAAYAATRPFAVRVVPSELLGRLRDA